MTNSDFWMNGSTILGELIIIWHLTYIVAVEILQYSVSGGYYAIHRLLIFEGCSIFKKRTTFVAVYIQRYLHELGTALFKCSAIDNVNQEKSNCEQFTPEELGAFRATDLLPLPRTFCNL